MKRDEKGEEGRRDEEKRFRLLVSFLSSTDTYIHTYIYVNIYMYVQITT
jgi:hypothetical protein